MCQFDLAFVRNVLLDLSQYIPDCAFKMDPLATLIEVIVPCRDDGAKYLGQQRNQSKATEPDRCTASANSAYFVVLDDTTPPSRIELGREPLLLCRLYLGLMQTLNDGHELKRAKHSHNVTRRAIEANDFFRPVTCPPLRLSTIAQVG